MPEDEPFPSSGIRGSLRSSAMKSPQNSKTEREVIPGFTNWDGGREMELPFPSWSWPPMLRPRRKKNLQKKVNKNIFEPVKRPDTQREYQAFLFCRFGHPFPPHAWGLPLAMKDVSMIILEVFDCK